MASVKIGEVKFTVLSEDSQTFRCGKTVTTVRLRSHDTEIEVVTSKDWVQVLGAERVAE